jgi:hypothetical protein
VTSKTIWREYIQSEAFSPNDLNSVSFFKLYYHAEWTNLFVPHSNHLLLDVFGDNLVQIYPRHAFRDIIPKIWGKQ